MNKPTTPVVADAAGRARFTTAEFLRMGAAGAFDDMKIELVDGELQRMNPPMSAHGLLQGDIVFALRTSCTGAGLDVCAEVGIDLGHDTLLRCDAALVRRLNGENRMLRPEEIVLVVEVAVTTQARDLGLKRGEYARAGIPTYWAVDGERRVVHVFAKPAEHDYSDARLIPFGAPLDVPGTEGTITLG